MHRFSLVAEAGFGGGVGEGARSFTAVHRLLPTAAFLLQKYGSCPEACGIFPDQGSNLCPRHCQEDSQPLDHPGFLMKARQDNQTSLGYGVG